MRRSSTTTSAPEALYALATAAARSVVVVGTAKNVGKTTTFNALCAVARRRGETIAVTSIGRDGEPADALDAQAKPRVRLAPGTLVALAEGILPRSPALVILERGALGALGTTIFARVVLPTLCEIAGPPSARAMRETIDRLRALGTGPVLVDGAIDRVAPLAGGDDAVIVATGAASGASVERVAALVAETVARLTIPADDGPDGVRIDGALGAAQAQELIAGPRGTRVVVADPTRVVVRGALFAALRAHVDLRCARPLRVVACTTAPVGREGAFAPRALVEAVARATGLPTFDVVADLAA
ncbi:MAG TPA: hypothetical protein VMA36_11700 [Candidatus Limnocylindria bacterium]|nr:hypothetical protein [Candidatus Limnocylindria bacterium]